MWPLAWILVLSPSIWSISSAFKLHSQFQTCPDTCSDLGPNQSNWTFIHDFGRITRCNKTVLFDLNLYNNIDDADTHTTIRACTADNASKLATTAAPNLQCGNFTPANVSVEVSWSGKSAPMSQSQAGQLFSPILSQLANAQPACGSKILFSEENGTIVSVYAGGSVDASSSINGVVKQLTQHAMTQGFGKTTIAQSCGNGIDSNYTVGILVSADGDLALAQTIMQTWSNSTCLNGLESSLGQIPVTMFTKSLAKPTNMTSSMKRQSTCSTVQVVSGDSCGSLAAECGISATDFSTFNPNPDLCSTLAVGQFLCCSAGSLPDFAPQEGSDGSCFQYTVQANDFCESIANAHFITSTDIENFNTDTWGWQGCGDVQLGQIICLSAGTPPFPAPVTNTVCGPQVPGTQPPADFSTLADLNPCPLNSCCNIFGQCGITPEFCTISPSVTGAPGTSAPGIDGCISNCGFEIVNNSTGPSSFIKIGYWEAFNTQRSCLTMSVSQIPAGFTHIHYAFSTITSDFQVDNSDTPQQFQDFVDASGFKRVISFGGWSFSTDEDSAPIFGSSFSDENRQAFAQSIVDMINDNNLDGVDFDWEYPDAPASPGVPQGSPTDGPNYLKFLQTLRAMLPEGKTLSMTAPASFFFLVGFPIAEMELVLDYIVFMTYDLHGQWDFGNAFTNPGCPTGNCLRSHINLTETEFALSMITKAGVPTNKIAVGVSSYGRSFGMTTPGCTGVDCFFDGPASDALPGPCTQTAGYIADAEIKALISQGGLQLRDDPSDSDIVVYGNTWIAYMAADTKASRISLYQSMNLAGTADWAIDLESGDVTGFFGNSTDQDNPTPANVPIIPLTCTSLAPGATFTLTADCAAEIASMPVMSNNNVPPGPSPCTESCNLLRQITGTCCGIGGSIANPVDLIPGVQLPLALPLPDGFQPSTPLTIPGFTLQPGQPAPVSFQIPAGFQSPTSMTIPGGVFPPGSPLGVPVILQPGFTPIDPLTIGMNTLPAGEPLSNAVPLNASFVPPGPSPLVVAPFDISPGDVLDGPVVLPPGVIFPVPVTIPPTTFPPDDALPPGVIFPPGAFIPIPISLLPGPLLPDPIVPPPVPIADDGDDGEEDENDPVDDPGLLAMIDPDPSPVPNPTLTPTTMVAIPTPTQTDSFFIGIAAEGTGNNQAFTLIAYPQSINCDTIVPQLSQLTVTAADNGAQVDAVNFDSYTLTHTSFSIKTATGCILSFTGEDGEYDGTTASGASILCESENPGSTMCTINGQSWATEPLYNCLVTGATSFC